MLLIAEVRFCVNNFKKNNYFLTTFSESRAAWGHIENTFKPRYSPPPHLTSIKFPLTEHSNLPPKLEVKKSGNIYAYDSITLDSSNATVVKRFRLIIIIKCL
jgi:hypothetical protein